MASEAKKASQKAAFSRLFNPRAAATDAGAPAAAAAAGPGSSASGGGGAYGGSAPADGGAVGLQGGGGGLGASRPHPANGPSVASFWFAMSSLTGRLHAFGSCTDPQAVGASAPTAAIIDGDAEQLPPELAQPSTLGAAQVSLAISRSTFHRSSNQTSHQTSRPLIRPLINQTPHQSDLSSDV